MNYRLIVTLLSIILFSLFGIFLLCGTVSLVAEPGQVFYEKWALCGLFSLVIGLVLRHHGRHHGRKIFYRDAIGLVSFAWIMTILIGTLPYLFLLPQLGIANALFESTSGFTSTGATVLQDLSNVPRSLLLFRAISQWIGGMGIVIFFVAFFANLGTASRVLFANESTQNSDDLNFEKLQRATLLIVGIYSLLTVLCAMAYFFGGMDCFEAICHAFTTISTGGLSTRNGGIADFHSPTLEWIAIIFMFLGAINFYTIIQIFRRQWRNIGQNGEWKHFFFLIALLWAMLLWLRSHDSSGPTALRESLFAIVSFMSTTGFSVEHIDHWLPSTHAILLLCFLIGGCSGSSAGGLKVIRIATAVKILRSSVEKTFRPRLVCPISVNGHQFTEKSQAQLMQYIFLVAIAIVVTYPIYLLLEPSLSLEGSLASFCACLFNGGSTFAEFSHNYASLHCPGKLFLSFLMLLGRLEMYAILALFLPAFWKKFS